jgi:hypothetical protein
MLNGVYESHHDDHSAYDWHDDQLFHYGDVAHCDVSACVQKIFHFRSYLINE